MTKLSNTVNVVAISNVSTVTKNFQGQTGPKTEAGKNRSKFNALKHARYAKSKILPHENEKEYKHLLKDMFEDLKPEGQVQEDLVLQYVDCLWRMHRMDSRISIEQKAIFNLLTKEKMAAMLEIDELFWDFIPDYFLNLNKRFGKKQIELAALIWNQYTGLMRDFSSGEFTDWSEIRIHYDALFLEFEIWVRQQDDLSPLLTPQRDAFNPQWLANQELLFDTVKDFAISMYFQANFMSWKDQIRNWMTAWYFLQKKELKEIDQFYLAHTKLMHLAHTNLERLVKLQKYKHGIAKDLQKHYRNLVNHVGGPC